MYDHNLCDYLVIDHKQVVDAREQVGGGIWLLDLAKTEAESKEQR